MEIETRLRVASGTGQNETEASSCAFEQLKKRGNATPPDLISDGWGGIREALVDVFGTVPAYKGVGRPPSKKQAGDDWHYLQYIKIRNQRGSVIGTKTKAIFGDEETLKSIFKPHTAYIERTHLTMRQSNNRLIRKGLGFSKSFALHKAAMILDDAVYNFVEPCKSLRVEVNPEAKRFETRYQQRTPAMAAGITDQLCSLEYLLRMIPVPKHS